MTRILWSNDAQTQAAREGHARWLTHHAALVIANFLRWGTAPEWTHDVRRDGFRGRFAIYNRGVKVPCIAVSPSHAFVYVRGDDGKIVRGFDGPLTEVVLGDFVIR